jgi:hypothetical protein
MWKWPVLLMIQRNMLKVDVAYSSEMLVTQPTCTWFIYGGAGLTSAGYVKFVVSTLKLSWKEGVILPFRREHCLFFGAKLQCNWIPMTAGHYFLSIMH